MHFPHDRGHLLNIENAQYKKFLEQFFAFQLDQDGEDITTSLLDKDGEKNVSAYILARETGVLAGKEEVDFFVKKFLDVESFKLNWKYADGEQFSANEKIVEISAPANVLLPVERIFLNVLSRLCGIATVTKKMVNSLPPAVGLAATRKTLWGMLDKKAVAVGGGLTHRLGLFDALLVKENHLSLLANGATEAAQRIVEHCSDIKDADTFWEIEVENEAEFTAVKDVFINEECAVPGVIMLDNFTPDEIKKLLKKYPKESLHERAIFIEASGGITEKNFSAFAISGADVLSSGFLTHTPRPIDFSLRIA